MERGYEGFLHGVRKRIDRHVEEGTVPASVLLEPLREFAAQEKREGGFDKAVEVIVDHLHWRLRYAVRRHYDTLVDEKRKDHVTVLRRLKDAERFMERLMEEIAALGPEGEGVLEHEALAYAEHICAHFKTLARAYADLMASGSDEKGEDRLEA